MTKTVKFASKMGIRNSPINIYNIKKPPDNWQCFVIWTCILYIEERILSYTIGGMGLFVINVHL